MKLIDKESLMEAINCNKPLADGYHMKDYVFSQIITDIESEPIVEAIPIEYIENWLKELRKSLRNVQMSIPAYNDTMNKLDEFERVIHMMIYNWREENETD